MPYVEFYKLQNDGSQTVIATCTLGNNGIVSCEGDTIFTRNLEREGIRDYSAQDRKPLYFKDGMKFLEQLQYNFTSGYLNASEVKK